MEPIVLKVYDTDVERIGEIVQQVGYLMIVENKINLSKVEVTYYNAVYIPKSCTGLISTFQSRITAYDNLLQCMLHFDKEGYYLKSKDMQQFTNIAKLQFKQIFEKMTDPYDKKIEEEEEEEEEEENTIFCVKCGKDLGGSFFRLSDGPYCLECYRDNFCCKKEKEVEVKDKEIENCIKKGKCDRCGQVKPIEGEEGEQQLCYHCFYDLDTEEKA